MALKSFKWAGQLPFVMSRKLEESPQWLTSGLGLDRSPEQVLSVRHCGFWLQTYPQDPQWLLTLAYSKLEEWC